VAWPGHFDACRALGSLLCLCALCVGVALAAEPMLARVIAVNADQVTLELAAAQDAEAEARQLRITLDTSAVPAGVEPGAWVRVWPAGEDGAASTLQRARLVPLGALAGDRTGVRSRLIRGAGLGGARGRGGY
jgi:hypothetical protein